MKPIYATTATNHPTGDAFFKNQIATVSPQYDAEVKTGRALALGATNDLPIPTHIDGYITYHNLDTDTITQEATDGTDKVFNTITLNNILTHKMPFSAGDLTLIQQEPNLLAALAMGEATPISSVTLDADDSWYACSEVSGAEVFDGRVAGNDTTISGDLTNVRITNQQKGLQTTALLLDANGVPESYNSLPNTARVYDDTIISTGFKPSIARYSIEESVSGLMQGFSPEVLGNASLDGDGSPWTAIFGLATFANGTATVEMTGSSAGIAQNTVVIEADKTYIMQAWYKFSGSFNILYFYINGPTVGSTDDNYFETTFDTNGETDLTYNFRVYGQGGAVGDTMEIYHVSVKELTTKTQRTEKRVLTKSALGENRYYIGTDGGAMVEQDVVPPLPDPDTIINLGNVSVIGYPDTIDTRLADFNVHSEVIIPQGE